MTNIFGYLFDPLGQRVKAGTISLTLQQDMVSADGTKVAPFTVSWPLDPLIAPNSPTSTPIGVTGTTPRSYTIAAVDFDNNETMPGTATVVQSNTFLSVSNFNRLAWSASARTKLYRVYRDGQLIAETANLTLDDTGLVATSTTPQLANGTGGFVWLNIYPTDGASPAGLAYLVEYDPTPTDLSKPARTKDGYWSNYWAVPNEPSVALGAFVSALRGQPANNYMPLNAVISSVASLVTLGSTELDTFKRIIANQESSKPEIRFNPDTQRWELSNDGSTFDQIATPVSSGDISSVNPGTGLTGGGSAGDVTLGIAVQADPSWLTELAFSKLTGVPDMALLDQANVFNVVGRAVLAKPATALATTDIMIEAQKSTGVSVFKVDYSGTVTAVGFTGNGANLTNLNASQLAFGTVPVAALANIADTQIASAAAIAWSKISKAGSSLGDLANRSASLLSGGTLPAAVFPAALPAIDGSALTVLNAAKLTTGTIPSSAFPATLPGLNGSNLTNLDAGQLTTGTIAGGRFPTSLPAVNGSALTSLTADNLTGTLPNGVFPAVLPAVDGSALTGVTTTQLQSAAGANQPAIRYNGTLAVWEFSNDGTSFSSLGSGGSGGSGTITGVAAGTGLSGGGTTGNVTLNIASQANPTWLTSLAASKLTGTLPDAVFPATLPAVSGANLTSVTAGLVQSGSGASQPRIRYNAGVWEFSNDGTSFTALGSGGGGNAVLVNAANVLTYAGTALTLKPSSALSGTAKMVDLQTTGGSSVFSVDYSGAVVANTIGAGSITAGVLTLSGAVQGSSFSGGTSAATILGDVSQPFVLKTSGAARGSSSSGEFWIEVAGSSPTKTITGKFNDGGTVRDVFSITV